MVGEINVLYLVTKQPYRLMLIPAEEHDPLAEHPACKNCGTPHWPGEKYCADCGQKIFTGPPTLWKLIADFFENLFNIDNRIFRTLATLVIPGKLTIQYLEGRQQPYLNPLRFFFVATVLMLATAALFLTSEVEEAFNEAAIEDRMTAFQNIFREELNVAVDSVKTLFPDTTVAAATDSLKRYFVSSKKDSLSLVHFEYTGGLVLTPVTTKFAHKDLYTMSPKEVVDKYEITGWFHRLQLKQIIRIDTMDSRGLTVLFGQLVWGLLFIIPFCAIMLKLFYIRRKRLFVEHVIFSLHVHSFLFLLLAIGFILFYFWGVPYGVIFAGIASVIYFPLALKRVYGQSWRKTLFKVSLLFLGYVMILSVCALISVAIAVAMY